MRDRALRSLRNKIWLVLVAGFSIVIFAAFFIIYTLTAHRLESDLQNWIHSPDFIQEIQEGRIGGQSFFIADLSSERDLAWIYSSLSLGPEQYEEMVMHALTSRPNPTETVSLLETLRSLFMGTRRSHLDMAGRDWTYAFIERVEWLHTFYYLPPRPQSNA